MKKEVNFFDFCNCFRHYGPKTMYKFTQAGLSALYDYLVAQEKATGQDYTLDVPNLAKVWDEYSSLLEYNSKNGTNYRTMEELGKHTVIIETPAEGFLAKTKQG